jgi:N-acetylneuraminate synthase
MKSIMAESEIEIAGRKIGAAHPPYVVCELSANHGGSLDKALKMIDAAAATGADAIKIQTYTPDTLTIDSERPEFKIKGGLWDGRTLYDLYREAFTPFEWHPRVFAHAREIGITLFSTPFDESATELLASLGAPAYKIASFEAIDLSLIAHVAKKRKPMIISTGMANLGEIHEAVTTARQHGCGELALLHCTSAYPAPIEAANIRTVPHLGDAFGVVSGLSDHTPGIAAAIASVVLGGAIIEKHFTLSRADGGPDAAFSLEPDEFKRLVEGCKAAYAARGRVDYERGDLERQSLVFRRSLFVVRDVEAGAPLTPADIRSIRPGHGLPPKHLPEVIGRRAARFLERGTPLAWADLIP